MYAFYATCILVVLKILGQISWPIMWILAPLWMWFLIICLGVAITIVSRSIK